MSGSNEDKANEWMAQAEKKLKSFSLFNSSGKYEEAAEMFVKAANLYKLAKKSITRCKTFEITHFFHSGASGRSIHQSCRSTTQVTV
jgi:hypothetical protein